MCAFNFLLGLPMVCSGGFYLFYLVDSFLSSYPLLAIALVETIVICHIYGLKQFLRDIEMMINVRPNWYWRVCWLVSIPLLSFALIVLFFVYNKPLQLGDYVYPDWALVIGHLIAATPVCAIIGWFVYKYCHEGGYILMREFFKPAFDWGPAQNEHRAQFLTKLRDRIHRTNQAEISNMVNSTPGIAGAAIGNGVQFGYIGGEHGGSVVSGLAGTGIIDDTGFFQSKLSVAEKFTKEHSKEVLKRAVSINELASTDALAALTSSQPLIALIAPGTHAGIGQSSQSSDTATAVGINEPQPAGTTRFSASHSGGSEAQVSQAKGSPVSRSDNRASAGLSDRADGLGFTTKLSPVRESYKQIQATTSTTASGPPASGARESGPGAPDDRVAL